MYNQIFKLQESTYKALAHSRRIEIINLLREESLSVSDIYKMLDLPQANVSQHLQVLRDAEVLVAVKKGKQVFYSISDDRFVKMIDMVREILVEKFADDPLADELTKSMKDLVPLTHDIVCKMRVSPATAGFVVVHKGETHYFCASGCLESFKKEPNKYAK